MAHSGFSRSSNVLKRLAIIAAAGLAGACGEAGRAADAPQAAHPAAPRGAVIGADGFATIMNAPPAPYTPVEPGAAPPLTPERIAAQQQFRRASEFQNDVREDVQALSDTLRRSEKGNFVDLYYENAGDPHVVFRFLRDGSRTLAKYTRNPKFVASTARYSNAELRAAMDFMMRTFRDDRVIAGGGYGNKRNRAEIEINVTEPEFRALVAKKGVTIPDAVELHFTATRPASAINRPLPPDIAPLVRIFPRSDRPLGMINAIASRTKIVLKDGCFRSPDNGDALVLFPLGAQLFIDRDGYLAFGGREGPGHARVGETIVTPGSIAEITAADLVQPIHAACGPGKVVQVNGMASAAAEDAQYAVTSNANSLRQLRRMYGLSEPLARKALEACKTSMGMGACMLSPPPPILRKEGCPAGTTLSAGLCRTPEGYIRPLPKWIVDLKAG